MEVRGWVCGAVVAALAWSAPAAADPIPQSAPKGQIPDFVGGPATSQPISIGDAPPPPRHPFMAPNDRSNIHDDAYQTDTADGQGPLGRDMETLSQAELGDCGSLTFDSQGRVETVCVGLARPVLRLLDPRTLDDLASFDLPPRQGVGSGGIFTDFSGGGYFYLDNRDRAIVVTTTRHLFVIGQTPGPGFAVEHDYDLTSKVPDSDKLFATMPDWSGRIWFVTRNGIVGTVDQGNGAVRTLDTHEPIGNSFAVDEKGAVYIVTDGALYRFEAADDGTPKAVWREVYANDHTTKSGQTEAGSGTTPTLMGNDYVSITDNADPMDVVVYKRGRSVRGSREVCSVPVFEKGQGSTDNSLIGTARSMVVENNFGYAGPQSTIGGSTVPGVWRVDIDADGRGCHVVWRSDERSPTVVPKLSLENGLVYLYTKDPDPQQDDPWYLTAIDFRTGRTVYKVHVGNGFGFNNNYAPVSLGPDGTAYVGVLGGLTAIRDQVPPARVRRPGDEGAASRRRPLVALGLRGLSRRRARAIRHLTPRRGPTAAPFIRCARHDIRAVIAGPDRRRVRRVEYRLTRHRRVVRSRRPLRPLRIRRRGLIAGRSYLLVALLRMRDGRSSTRTRTFRAC
jgi:hypothetical protein